MASDPEAPDTPGNAGSLLDDGAEKNALGALWTAAILVAGLFLL
jgi:hypothetical protein